MLWNFGPTDSSKPLSGPLTPLFPELDCVHSYSGDNMDYVSGFLFDHSSSSSPSPSPSPSQAQPSFNARFMQKLYNIVSKDDYCTLKDGLLIIYNVNSVLGYGSDDLSISEGSLKRQLLYYGFRRCGQHETTGLGELSFTLPTGCPTRIDSEAGENMKLWYDFCLRHEKSKLKLK